MQKYLPIFFLVLLIRVPGEAQTAITRYEHEMKQSDDGFTIVSLKERGIALIRDSDKYEDGKNFWEVILLDNELKETWAGNIKLLPRFNLIGFDAPEDGHVYFLYREGESNLGDLLLVRLRLDTGVIDHFEIKHEFNFQLTHFSILKTSAILGGYVNQEPAVLLFDLTAGTTKVLPGFFLKETELLDVRTNKNGTFNTLLMARGLRNNRHLVIKTFDGSGALLLEDKVEIDQKTTILSAVTSRLVREELMIFGTYALGTSRRATGYFVTKVDPFADQEIHFYEFTLLNHFLDYMKPRRAVRTKMKAQRRRQAGKPPIYKCYIQPIKVLEHDGGFILLSEAFDTDSNLNQPYWNSPYYPYYGYGFMPYRNYPYGPGTYRTPYDYDEVRTENIEMLQSVAAFFYPDGTLVSDHSMEFDDVKLEEFEQVSALALHNGQVYLMKKEEKHLVLSARDLRTDSLQRDTVSIPTEHPADEVRFESEQDAGLRHWYGRYIFVWGYQSIRDPEAEYSDRVRYAFYLVKYGLD